jgi:transcriptional regulator with XRE-family HTH domain
MIRSENKLAEFLKKRRHALGFSQRALAEQLDIEPSYIAFLESGRRKPSLALLERIANVLRCDAQELFLLTHPEAKSMVTPPQPKPKPKQPAQAWQELMNNRAMLERYQVTSRELHALQQLSLLGYVLSPREFLTILTVIRRPPEEA